MTYDEKRIAIARLLPDLLIVSRPDILWKSDWSTVLKRDWFAIMHEAEKTLKKNPAKWREYKKRLLWLPNYGVDATATQRCDAFLAVVTQTK